MINNICKTLFFMCGISIFTLNTADARICYLLNGENCNGQSGYELIEKEFVKIPRQPNTITRGQETPVSPNKTIPPQEEVTPPDNTPFVCVGYNLSEPLGHDYACSSCTDDSGTHYQCQLICSADKCGDDEVYNTETCMCDAISDACKKFMYKFKSVAYSPMSPSECTNTKGSYGLQSCTTEGNDYYAGAVMACGGTENIISAEEAEELAYCMYNPTETYSSIYGNRFDGFLKSYDADTSDHVFVWVNWEGSNPNDKGAIVRMYDTYGSIPYVAERNGSQYYIDEEIENDWENRSILSHTLCRI